MQQSSKRHFLFLQGPHGPFFYRLAQALSKTGARVCRIGFNAGDRAFWRTNAEYIAYNDSPEKWPETFSKIVQEQNVTDIVLYGDTRPMHAKAIEIANNLNLRIHVYEEGYMRPYWVTYERDGSNGHSRLMSKSIADMRADLPQEKAESANPPAHWGDMRQHVFYGAVYHWFVLFRNRAYSNFKPHRALSLRKETYLYTRRLFLMPYLAISRSFAARRIRRGGYSYHLALMQLEHDASFQAHSPFSTMEEFAAAVIAGFASGAPPTDHLVFKAHPLENGNSPLAKIIQEIAQKHNVEERIHYLHGGKLAPLLDKAKTAVTVNSTAAQQAMWRGLPVKIFGEAVYAKPELVSEQPIAEFFQDPDLPDETAYRDFRRYLLETSQVPGGFYASKNRKQLLELAVEMMIAPHDPYEALAMRKTSPE